MKDRNKIIEECIEAVHKVQYKYGRKRKLIYAEDVFEALFLLRQE